MVEGRLISGGEQQEDADAKLRPQHLKEFVGQRQLCDNLSVFISAASGRSEPLDHVLFHGPPGLGKTTLAQIVSRELGVGFRATSGPMIAKAGDLAAILTNLEARDVLFIDEIHRLNPAIEEVLYPAMEDFQLDLIIGEGPAARSVRIELQPFTLVGFGIPMRLEFYKPEELVSIVERGAKILGLDLAPDGALEIAKRSRGTPRVAGRLLRRVRDFAAVDKTAVVDAKAADAALQRLDVDALGLDAMDRRYLTCIAEFYSGGPVGVDTLSAALAEERDTLEDVVEPFLIQQGLLQRTPRGRILADSGYRHIGLQVPNRDVAQFDMLGDDP